MSDEKDKFEKDGNNYDKVISEYKSTITELTNDYKNLKDRIGDMEKRYKIIDERNDEEKSYNIDREIENYKKG